MKTVTEFSSSFPAYFGKLNKASANTIRIKSNGPEYGSIIAEMLPILESWATLGKLPDPVIELAQKMSVKGNLFQRVGLTIVGRSEAGHNIGISATAKISGKTGTVGIDAATKACKASAQSRSVDMVKVVKDAYAAEKAKQSKPTEKPAPKVQRKPAVRKTA